MIALFIYLSLMATILGLHLPEHARFEVRDFFWKGQTPWNRFFYFFPTVSIQKYDRALGDYGYLHIGFLTISLTLCWWGEVEKPNETKTTEGELPF